MKPTIVTLLLAAVISTWSFGQDLTKKVEVNYSDPFQVDSSEYFLIPELLDNDHKEAYGKGLGHLSWGSYTNVYFYNSKTNQTKKLFDQLALINSFSPHRYYSDFKTDAASAQNILPEQIVYLARTENFNGDKALDSEDPVYLFLSSKTGNDLKQITPKGFHVISWTVSKDKKTILVKGKNDKNGNRKFGNGDDDLYYRIDLKPEISKVQCTLINM